MKHSSQMSLPAMFFGDRFCFGRKGWIGGGEWVHPKGANSDVHLNIGDRFHPFVRYIFVEVARSTAV